MKVMRLRAKVATDVLKALMLRADELRPEAQWQFLEAGFQEAIHAVKKFKADNTRAVEADPILFARRSMQ